MRKILLACLVPLALLGCNRRPQATKAQGAAEAKAAAAVGTKDNVLQTLAKANDLSIMAKFVKSAGLETTLAGVGNYTLFAPTDAAFAKFPADQRKLLETKDGKPQLLAMLRQHIAAGYITQADLTRGLARNGGAASLATMGGAPIRLHRNGDAILLGPGDTGPRLVSQAIPSRNGVIYRIDQVLPPPHIAPAKANAPAR